MEWYFIVAIIIGCVAVLLTLSVVLYRQFFKRFYDIVLSFIALVVLSPLLIVLTVVDAIAMKGNPFFVQARPGMINKKTGQEKIFKLIKFRTMSNAKDENGNLLPDEVRLNKFGKILRSTSLDELPELLNILIGDLSIVGPRPLLVEYLPWYTLSERKRHTVRPGLTGWAQVNGRNLLGWDKRLQYDIDYVSCITFLKDIKIIFLTVKKVISRSDIVVDTDKAEGNFAKYRKGQMEDKENNE